MPTSTIPAFIVQQVNITLPQGSAIEANILAQDTTKANVDLTAATAPGPWTLLCSITPSNEDTALPTLNPTATKGAGFATIQAQPSAPLPLGSYNFCLTATDVTNVVHTLALGTVRSVPGVG